MKKRVIIIGINNGNTLGLIRSLGKCGYPVVLFLEPCDKYFCALRFSKYLTRIHYLDNLETALYLLRGEYAQEKSKTVILTGSDRAAILLDRHYDELRGHYVFFNAGMRGRVTHFLDKINTFPLAKAAGIRLIKTWRVFGGEKLPDDLVFPCLVKGNNSTTSSKSHMAVCRDRTHLIRVLEKGVDYLVQEFLEKEYELDIVGLSCRHGRNILLPGAVYKVREFLDRQSLFVRLDDVTNYPNLPIDAIKRLVLAIGYEGMFSVELIFTKGMYYFLEINLRNDAMAYIYTKGGVNYPDLWARVAAGGDPDKLFSGVHVRTPLYMMQEADFYAMFAGRVNFFRWIGDFCRTRVFPVFDPVDIKPFAYTMLVHVLQVGKRLLRLCGFNIKLR